MADRIDYNPTESAPVLVVGSVAFDNVITPHGSKDGILGEPHPTVHLLPVILRNLVWWE